MSKIKLNDAITKKAFLGFMIAIAIFYFMNIDVEWVWPLPANLKFIVYVSLMGILVILEIPRPGIAKFMTDVFEALNDGKLTPAEKLSLIQSAKDNLFGQWADLSRLVAEEEEIEKEEKKELAPLD